MSTNGVLSSGAAINADPTNEALPTDDFGAGTDQNILLPYWDDLDLDGGGANVYFEETTIGGDNVLIVQWDSINRFPTSATTGTFQAQVFDSESDPFRFVYADVDFSLISAFNNGGSATVGYQDSATDFTQVSFNAPTIQSGSVVAFSNPEAAQPGIEFELANSSQGEDGVGGTVPTLLVNLDLTGTTAAARTVSFSLTAGLATGATPGVNDDFTLDLSFTIPEGDYSGGVTAFDLTQYDSSGVRFDEAGFTDSVVEIFQDNLVEGLEGFSFNITNGIGIALNVGDVNGDEQSRSGTNHFIVDDDLIRVTVDPAQTVVEGNTLTGSLSVESSDDNGATWVPGLGSVALPGGSQIAFDLVNGGTGTAGDPSDFSFPTASFVIPSGFTGNSFSFSIPTVDDSLIEGTETVDLTIANVTSQTATSISNPLNSQFVSVDNSVEILDNDVATFNIAQSATAVTEGGRRQLYDFVRR